MLNRSALKDAAKQNLAACYWLAVAVTLIYLIASGLANGSPTGLRMNISFSVNGVRIQGGDAYRFLFQSPFPPAAYLGAVLALLGLAVKFLAVNPLETGMIRFFLNNAEGRPYAFEDLLHGFRGGRYPRIILGLFLRDLIVFAGYLLLLVPGVILSYMFRFAPYVLASRDDLTATEALQISAQMTRGIKWELFVLDLSFLGWSLLAGCLCGLGVIFLMPYVQATWAELYRSLEPSVAPGS